MQFLTLLRSGGEYNASHVERLHAQLAVWGIPLKCITDLRLPSHIDSIPMISDWPKWWCKLEAFRPDLPNDFVFCDLDTAFVGNPSFCFEAPGSIMLRDFYRPNGLQSSLFRFTDADRAYVWRYWTARPYRHIAHYMTRRAGLNGDQNFLEDTLKGIPVLRWQDEFPGAVQSWKVTMNRGRELPDPRTKIIVFHGKPRPWEVGL
jgi:hypothetical protein